MLIDSRAGGVLGASLVCGLLLTGCSGPAPEETRAASAVPAQSATPTPTLTPEIGEVEEPQSAQEAIAGATVSANSYFALRAEIEVSHPADSSAIDTVAVGEAAEEVHGTALDLVASGTTFAGAYTFDVTDDSYVGSAQSPDGTVYPFGTAHLLGCFDTSGITATHADGSPVEMNPLRRGVLDLTVVYYAPEKSWLVQAVQSPDENVPC